MKPEYWSRDAVLSWTAGIIDGEGCIRFHRLRPKINHASIVLSVAVVNTNLKMLDLLINFWGGKYTTRTSVPNARAGYTWEIYADNARNLLVEIFPYLICKIPQAELAIVYQERMYEYKKGNKYGRGRVTPESERMIREEMFKKMAYLNRRGE